MKYSKVYLEAFGYELAPVVVASTELEARLGPVYEALHFRAGQLEALTGIAERRWWEEGFRLSEGAVRAARRALAAAEVRAQEVGTLIYGGVCREYFEPTTACRVASELGISPEATVYDIGNACLGVLNGIIEVANQIELGQIRCGLVVASETAREINDIMIDRMCQDRTMDCFKLSLATLTGGSGAVAVLLSDGSFSRERRRRLLGGVTRTAPEHHGLCRWGIEAVRPLDPYQFLQFTSTDSAGILT
ncbi:MAG: 3-oxoacyl-ACP synthase III, partial [Planctomycetaceae bacterium]|nr:3-oxoacyl-ACP synthase III [Planctomycetaceae bacterium]